MMWRWQNVCVCAAGVAVSCALVCPAQSPDGPSATEDQVKAAYLYNFLLFVDWGGRATTQDQSIVLGVLGRDSLCAALESVNNKPVGATKRRLNVVCFRTTPTTNELQRCSLLFVGRENEQDVAGAVAAVGGEPVLTVGEVSGFLEHGGIVNLVRIGSSIRWEINRDAVRRAGLSLSSQLLRNAVRLTGAESSP